ncbi:di-heme oxidoredictase family protein [Parahaliea maris]|nr:di-heme oxidoredictase family protein [Parahaliea maris]
MSDIAVEASTSRAGGAVGIFPALVLALAAYAGFPGEARAHTPHQCPQDFPDLPAISGHLAQGDIDSGRISFSNLFRHGREVFSANWNHCDGQGRPATTGTGAARVPDEPAFIRTSGPDANSCAGCHNVPRAGGAGDFVANVFVLAQAQDPVITSLDPAFSNERNTLGMFGAGAIEMLAREMTAELQQAAAQLGDGEHTLNAKGIPFEVTLSGGEVIASRGVDTDLVVKPFHQAGVVVSLREFTVNAFNHHHGMQPEERFDLNPANGFNVDHDGDGISGEMTIGDITAATVYQAALAVPGRVLPAAPQARREVAAGEALFEQVSCADCHIPALYLDNRQFVEPNPFNPAGTVSSGISYAFDLTREGEKPRLEHYGNQGAVVRAYTDLKRHNLCDEEIRVLCNEQLAQGRPEQDGRPGSEFFLTRKLWDVGNSAPYGHRGDLTTITEAILAHGGEARASRDAFVELSVDDQRSVIRFLRSLQVLPEGSPRTLIRP